MMPPPLLIPCAILAGGRSSRMGTDKTALSLGQTSMLERAIRTARGACNRVLVVGRVPPASAPDAAIEFLPDDGTPHAGPILGIITALQAAQSDILTIACDMPLLSSEILRRLYAAHAAAPSASAPLATLATTCDQNGKPFAEPLLAVYTQAILPILKERLAADRRSLQQLLSIPAVHAWPVPQDLHPQLLNVNDPASLEQARTLIASAGE